MLPPILSSSADRQSLRRTLRTRRLALSVFSQKKAAQALAHKLAALPALKKAQRVALYWPVDGEIDTRGLRRHAQMAGREFYLPVLKKFPANTLAFARWHCGKALHRNRFNIPEPIGRTLFSAQQMDIILLPLTGFDARGNRLGMGGGFYDRTLAFKKRKSAHRPLLCGVAHACQQLDALQPAPWDIPLNLVATDKKIFR